jgi:hypothetical protein
LLDILFLQFSISIPTPISLPEILYLSNSKVSN